MERNLNPSYKSYLLKKNQNGSRKEEQSRRRASGWKTAWYLVLSQNILWRRNYKYAWKDCLILGLVNLDSWPKDIWLKWVNFFIIAIYFLAVEKYLYPYRYFRDHNIYGIKINTSKYGKIPFRNSRDPYYIYKYERSLTKRLKQWEVKDLQENMDVYYGNHL